MHILKLGTRKSLLAWAQSSWVARKIEELNSDVRVEMVGIETRGDRVLDVSLRSMEGKEFFVAEIDDALKSGAVDFTVHSMKDLSLDRPSEFVNACTPRRENPRDAVLFGPGILEKLRAGKTIRIGTSSPRRLENIPAFLEKALPYGAKLEFLEIRGNVNTRLSRVREPADSPKALDAVVLAFAGLIRLWNDEKGREELSRLLQDVRWMILPLKECPAAPAQGALAVECRSVDARARAALLKLHDAPTAARVSVERQLLADWGGGCHQKFGATAITTQEMDEILFIRGKKPDETFVDEIRWKHPVFPRGEIRAWNGIENRAESDRETRPIADLSDRAVFVAHSRAIANPEALQGARVWTSGVASWLRLAAAGVWVEGCGEGFGIEIAARNFNEAVLSLPQESDWVKISHGIEGTYEVPRDYSKEVERIKRATHVFWGSASQWNELKGFVSNDTSQACGPGKTAQILRENGIKPLVFPSVEEWKKWLKI